MVVSNYRPRSAQEDGWDCLAFRKAENRIGLGSAKRGLFVKFEQKFCQLFTI